MEYSKSAERKYIWNFNNGSLRRQQKKIFNSFTSFHHTAYLENITNPNNGYRRSPSTSQALPPIPYIIPKHIKVLNSFLNYSNLPCKPDPDVPLRKNISKTFEKRNLVNKAKAIRNVEMESIPKETPEENNNQVKKINHSIKSQENELGVILEKKYEVLEGEEKCQNSNSLSSDESSKQNVLCSTIMKNLINQLSCAEQLFQKSHEENQKKMVSSPKLSIENGDEFKNDLSDDSEKAKEMTNKPLMSKKISNLRKIFEQKESRETIRNSNYSSSSSYHNQGNANWNSKHVDLSKLGGNGEAAKIKHSACLNSAMIDKIKEKVFSASKDSNNNQNYIHQNNALKFPKETSMAMKLLLNKRMVGLNENNVSGNLENILHSQQIRTKKKLILKCDPNLPCHKNLLCTKGNHSGRCDVRRTSSTKNFQNCQASWLHSNNYYEGDLDLLNNCLNLAFQAN